MPCTLTLGGIAVEQCASKPGLQTQVDIALVSDITTIGAAVDHAVSTITPAATKGFYKFFISRKENDLKSTPNENGGYTTELKGFLPKQEAAKAKILTKMNEAEAFIALATDQNGEKHLLGSLTHPVKARIEPSVTPRNGYTLTLMWEEHGDLPFFFTGTPTYAS